MGVVDTSAGSLLESAPYTMRKLLLRSAGAILVGLVFLCSERVASAAEKLVLLGGGPRPEAALARFVEWSGGSRGHVLIVSWASSEPAQRTIHCRCHRSCSGGACMSCSWST